MMDDDQLNNHQERPRDRFAAFVLLDGRNRLETIRRCRSIAELRSVLVKARALALQEPERERSAAAVERWLLAEVDRKRAARGSRRRHPPDLHPTSYLRACRQSSRCRRSATRR
jgi:hypothetical protein